MSPQMPYGLMVMPKWAATKQRIYPPQVVGNQIMCGAIPHYLARSREPGLAGHSAAR
jgi:hypothetical protein